jgi:group I intron endonuclease
MKTGIYQIQSSVKSYRIYIGSAKNIMRRWSKHLQDLRLNKHHSPHLQWHFNKYGEHDLQFSILENCGDHALLSREQHYLDIFKPYFNTCKIAGNTLGYKHSNESKKKISNAGLGNQHTLGFSPWNKGLSGYKTKPATEERKNKTSKSNKGKQAGNKHPNYGKHLSETTKAKISEVNKGHIVKDETRQKLRLANLGKKRNQC